MSADRTRPPDHPTVVAVSRAQTHVVRKAQVSAISLIAGRGVQGDAHFGTTVQHRHDRERDPRRPNLRQVHLIAFELYDDLTALGFDLTPGDLGENITTRGLDYAALPLGTRLHIGTQAVIELTGLRNPCNLIDRVAAGARAAVSTDVGTARVVRDAAMGIIVAAGVVRAGEIVVISLPSGPPRALGPV